MNLLLVLHSLFNHHSYWNESIRIIRHFSCTTCEQISLRTTKSVTLYFRTIKRSVRSVSPWEWASWTFIIAWVYLSKLNAQRMKVGVSHVFRFIVSILCSTVLPYTEEIYLTIWFLRVSVKLKLSVKLPHSLYWRMKVKDKCLYWNTAGAV